MYKALKLRRHMGKLCSKDISGRVQAVKKLGLLGHSGAVEPMLRLLDDGEASIRHSVVKALGELGDKRATGRK